MAATQRAQLKRARTPEVRPMVASANEALQARLERKDLERLPRMKMGAEASVAYACRNAGCDLERVEQLSQHLLNLPRSQEYAPAMGFVASIKERAERLPGDLVPPVANLTRHDLYAELAVSCLNLKCSPLELVAVGWYRATKEHPETFAEGNDDPTRHEQRIVALREKEQKLIEEGAAAVTIDDLEFELTGSGYAQVWYAISNRAVPATAPGDTRGIGGLVDWLEKNPEVLQA